jgi:hypothetical protein
MGVIQRIADRLRRLALLGDVALLELGLEPIEPISLFVAETLRLGRSGEDRRGGGGRRPPQEVEMDPG